MRPVCLLPAVWPQTPTTQATLLSDQIVEDKAIYNPAIFGLRTSSYWL